MRRLALLLTLAMLLGACSSGRQPAPSAAEETASEDGAGKGDGSANGRGAGEGGGKKGGSGKKGGGKGSGNGASEGDGGSDPASGVPGSDKTPAFESFGEGGPEFAQLTADYREPNPDGEREGQTPDYAEVTGIRFEGLGDDLRITMTFAGNVPQKLVTPNTYMVIGIGISGEKKGDRGYALGAQGSGDGWRAYAGAKDEAKRFPGTFFIRDNTVEMTVKWSFLGGPRPFGFYASSSWFSNIANQSSYVFDIIPNKNGRYPKG